MPKVVVIIPTYNESENIERTIKELKNIFGKVKDVEMHILVTDGNSPDGTGDIVKAIAKKDPSVRLIVEKEKNGLGSAYIRAMKNAFENLNADAIITFDADLSHDPKIIPQMIKEYLNGVDFICGTRYKKGGSIPQEWGIHRKALSIMGNLYVRILYFGKGITDFTSGYKLISKKTYDKIKNKIGAHHGYTFSISTNLESVLTGYKTVEIPYKFKDRAYGKSKMGTEYIVNAFYFVTMLRLKQLLHSRFGKVFVAGGFGSLAQFLSFGIIFKPIVEDKNIFNLSHDVYFLGLHFDFPALLALAFSIEVGIFTSYFVNNKWAFKDHRLSGLLFWRRFAKTNLVAFGAICIQLITFFLLSNIFGRNFLLDYIYQIVGILLGLIWNFYFYKKIIWKI